MDGKETVLKLSDFHFQNFSLARNTCTTFKKWVPWQWCRGYILTIWGNSDYQAKYAFQDRGHQHYVPSTADNNEDLTEGESSSQERSNSQEIVELEWSNIISFIYDLQLFEKSYLLIHVFLKRKCYDKTQELFTYSWEQDVMKRIISLLLKTKCYDESSRFILYFSQNIVVTVRLYCCLYKITCYIGYTICLFFFL